MRVFFPVVFAVILSGFAGVSAAAASESTVPKLIGCLDQHEIREEVAAKRVVPQVVALRAARGALGGEAVRARLCRVDGGLVYAITALKRDGKVVRVYVDAQTGKVMASN
ncbi:hypothetical protein GCM10007036_12940 [Alsobacter metallidurans]|uniref:PepSY domain-containing protein n=1 Tax=Alsobacter metallidurans TaxID=340221 RepID=A0A917MHC0_9HYPH|nr:PepSY domain-containing protein [Alsobacter metallidurans]GGH13967.1 hypothetical protein GCM10007036_12940 [Alsobacter metallidurans]